MLDRARIVIPLYNDSKNLHVTLDKLLEISDEIAQDVEMSSWQARSRHRCIYWDSNKNNSERK